ncbi:MAG: zinc ribbon domain-containing protein [Dehalococcoidia bacterium]
MKRSEETKKRGCCCPYCEEEIVREPTLFCQPCQVELRYCLKCNIVVERKAKVCPQCGQPLA